MTDRIDTAKERDGLKEMRLGGWGFPKIEELLSMSNSYLDALDAERGQALARLAVAQHDMRERCAKWHDEVVAHDQSGIDYSDAIGITISNRYELEQSVKAHEYSAREIRAIPLDPDAEAALQRVVDAAWNEAVEMCARQLVVYWPHQATPEMRDSILTFKRPEASHD